MSEFTVSLEKFMSIPVPTANGSIKMKMFDMEHCVKVYWPLYELMDELTAVEMKVLSYVMSQLVKGSDLVHIDVSDIIKYINRLKNGAPPVNPTKSRPHVYKGVSMLVDRGIISKKAGKVYYINPNMLFKGNRVSVVNK
jgi:hypothetical protein